MRTTTGTSLAKSSGTEELAVIGYLVVNFIGYYQQVMFRGYVKHLLNHLLAVYGAGWVVWVDDYEGTGFLGNLLAQVVHVRLPCFFLDCLVGDGCAFEEAGVGDVGRVCRAWEEDFVASLHDSCHRHLDAFRYAFGYQDFVGGNIYVVDAFFFAGNGFSEFGKSFGG